MNGKIDKTQFTLKKVKSIKNGGLDVEFDVAEIVGSNHYIDSKKITSTKFIHPDLEILLEKFKPYFSSNLGYDHLSLIHI